MKKFYGKIWIFVCTLVLLTSLGAIAQEEESSGGSDAFKYGINAGVNFHEFTSQPPHTGSKMGYSAGVFALYGFNDQIALQLDVAYFQQGGTYVQFIDDTRFGASENYFTKNVKNSSVTLHNVYIPLQAKLNLFSQPFLPKLLIGPYLDVNFAATESYERTGEIEDNVYVTSEGDAVVTDQYELLQVGATAGVEFYIPTGQDWNMIFGVHYKYGITPVKKSYSYVDYYLVTEDFYTNSLSITLGVEF